MTADRNTPTKPGNAKPAPTTCGRRSRRFWTSEIARPSGHRGQARPSDLCARRDHEPAADLGQRLPLQAEMFREAASTGGLDIQLRLFPRAWANAARRNGWRTANRLAELMSRIDCRGGHTQIGKVLSQPARRTSSRRCRRWSSSATRWRRSVDACAPQAGELGPAGVAGLHVSGGRRPVAENAYREIARLSRGAYCRFDTGSAQRARRIAARGCGLCGRRDEGAAANCRPQRSRRAEALGADEIMPTLIFGILVLVWRCGRSTSSPRSIPKLAARVMKAGGGLVRSGMAVFLGMRGEIVVALPLGAFGLGLLGWMPFGPAGFSARTQEAAGRSRGCARSFSRWSSITTPARCAGASLPAARGGALARRSAGRDAGRARHRIRR